MSRSSSSSIRKSCSEGSTRGNSCGEHKVEEGIGSAKISNTLLRMGLRRTQRDLREMTDWAHGFYEAMFRIRVVGDKLSEATDVLAVYEESQHPKPIMPPKMLKRKAVKKIVKKLVAEAITEYEKTRANPDNARGSGSVNAGGVVAPKVHGCTYKTFLNCQPHKFNGT
ncbi:hypothetical protein Tco_0844461 [Tanacetum coccineum]